MRQVPSNKKVPTMTKSGIYRINLGNGWFYIGSSANMGRRKRNHLCELVAQKHCNQKMQAIYNKYEVFKFEVLFECAIEELIIKEQVLLDAHFTDGKCANICPTAGSTLGYKHSAESQAKMSAAGKGKTKSAEHRAKMSAAGLGRIFSDEHRLKLSESGKIRWKKRKENEAKSANK